MGPVTDALRALYDWRTILDILFIAAVLSFLFHTLFSTGTWKIAGGVAVAALAAVLASALDLSGTEWFFSHFTQVAFLAILVIFQPEIRKLLERSSPFGRRRYEKETGDIPHLFAEVMAALGERRWGGIVVFPGRDPLGRWTTDGIPLMAAPSFPLLMSLFDPGSPGHDGAVVMEGPRVSRFGVHLPLSHTGSLSREYGTRHHAAMGLAEQTDALVLVASEERGQVSIFQEGGFQPAVSKSEVEQAIGNHLSGRTVEGISLGGTRKWRLAVESAASLVLASLFWLTVIYGRMEHREMFLTVPIQYTTPPGGLMLAGDEPSEARVLVEGPESSLNSFDRSRVRVLVELAPLAEGRHSFEIAPGDVSVPKGITAIEVSPSILELELLRKDFLEIPIRPQLLGAAPSGLRVASVEVVPQTLRVVRIPGTKQLRGEELLTTPIYLQGLRESSSVFCKIVASRGLRPLNGAWPDVEVRITLEKNGG